MLNSIVGLGLFGARAAASPMLGDRSVRMPQPRWPATLWSRIVAADPGLLRLLLALRGTLSVGLTATVHGVLATLFDHPITEFAFGVYSA